MIYLGIDPGYGRVGWGVIANDPELKCLGYGCIETPAQFDYVERYAIIDRQLSMLIKEYKPDAAGVELLFFGRNKTTAMRVSEARGVILLTLYRHKLYLPILEPTPNEVKAEIGDGAASKGQMQKMIKVLFGLDRLPKPDDAADALAVALFVERNHRVTMMAEGT